MTSFEFGEIILVPFPLQIKPTSIIGEVNIQEWQAAGLLKPSTIKPIITTIEKPLIIKAMGRLKDNDQKALHESLKGILG